MALTRIYNNQITNATIYANAKIVPGSIVGSLFNSNLTFTSDVTITGNLTVLGNNKVTSLSSTNTFVNDPLIVLNNGFTGSNSYDEGLVFNRGAGYNAAFIWNEYNSEFRFISNTSEQGTTYGQINQNTLGNVRVGNLNVNYSAEVAGNVDAGSGITTQGNIFVNGTAVGSIRTASTTFNLLNDTATTINKFGAATLITQGATTGTFVVNNPTVVGTQTTQNVFNANATTVNAFQAATTANIGATTGTLQINNPTVVGYNTTQNLWNTAATTVNAFGAAQTINMGAAGGLTTLAGNLQVNQNVIINGNLLVQGNIFSVNSSTLDTEGAILNINTGANGAPLSANIFTDSGIMSHFYNGSDTSLFFGRKNLTGYFTVLNSATFSNVTGNVTGTTGFVNANLIVNNGGVITLLSGAQIIGGGDLNSNVIYPESIAQFTSNANLTSKISIQNISTGTQAKAEFSVIATSGSNTAGYISTGIVGSSGSSSIYNPNDGYTRVYQGNLFLTTASVGKNIYLAAGAQQIANIVAYADGLYGNLNVVANNQSTSATTGALTVVGGVGIGGNLYVGYSGIGKISATLLNSQNSAGVFYAPTTQSLVINSGSYAGNTATVPGVTLAVRATDSIWLPVGTTAQRPSSTGNVDLQGMIRFSTSTGTIEWCTASGNPGTWTGPGSSNTLIYDGQYTGDGTTTVFTVNNASTTNATIVSINGVVQAPSISYAMSGGNLTFTEAPSVGDLIDVRTLTTTSTVTSLTSSNGFVALDVSNAFNLYANIIAGASSSVTRLAIDNTGHVNFVNNTSIVVYNSIQNAPLASTPVLLDTWTQTIYTAAKYVIGARVGSTNMESFEARVVTDGVGNAYISTYGIVNNGTTFSTLSANVVGGNVNVYYTSTIAQANVRILPTYIAV